VLPSGVTTRPTPEGVARRLGAARRWRACRSHRSDYRGLEAKAGHNAL